MSKTLLLEVKGLSGDFAIVELTHNEYTNAKRDKRHIEFAWYPMR